MSEKANTNDNSEVKDEETIQIRVLGQSGEEVFFKLKQQTAMARMFDAYCNRAGQARASIRFLYDGRRINSTDTAKSLEMEENDVIDAVLTQTGG